MLPSSGAAGSQTSHRDLILDPEAAGHLQAARLRRLNTRIIPVLRAGAEVVLLGCAALHAHNASGLWFTAEVQSLGLVLAIHAIVSGLAQRYLYGRTGALDISLVVLSLDFLPVLYAVHVTGNVHSWMFFVMSVHIADQAVTSSTRVLYFGILGSTSWLGYVGWLDAQGVAVPWGIELVKALSLLALAVHVAVITRTVEKLRHRSRQAMQIAHDSVERLEAQAVALRKSMEEAEAANRAKGQFLANVTHELRTPMNAVIGMTTLLMDTPLTDEQADYTSTVRTSAEHLLHLINDLLDLSKIEAGGMNLATTAFSPTHVVDDVVRMLARPAAARGIRLAAEVDPAVPMRVSGDPGRVRQVLLNLVHNAVKFTEAGSVTVGLRGDRPSRLRFEVRDTGIGMTREQAASVFEAFVQVDGSLSRRYDGTGLGLAIARRLTTLMGGTIDVTSEPGRGSTFWFTIPAPAAGASTAPEARLSLVVPRAPDLAGEGGGRRPLVLVAEDNVINQKVARKMLAKIGYDVDLAANGREAVEAARARRYDAILMDCQMPELDGFAATRAIRALEAPHGRVPILALTAAAGDDLRERCDDCGMDGLLTKPIAIDQLRDALLRWARTAA